MKEFLPESDYYRYIHSAEWRNTAKQRMELDKHTCQVCGRQASEVHHMTYERFMHEDMEDLVSLCHRCHEKAEQLYDPAITPWAIEGVRPGGNNFMAAMRTDAVNLAPDIFNYLQETRGKSFHALMQLRQPDDPEGKNYWVVLKKAVNALCRKRYARNCVADRADIMLGSISNHTVAVCVEQIEHYVRNRVQEDLHDMVEVEYAFHGKLKAVAGDLNIPLGTVKTLRKDDGSSYGPSLREAVLYYCGLDAAAGIKPLLGFQCLSNEDYNTLNEFADYMVSVSGTGMFRGESA